MWRKEHKPGRLGRACCYPCTARGHSGVATRTFVLTSKAHQVRVVLRIAAKQPSQSAREYRLRHSNTWSCEKLSQMQMISCIQLCSQRDKNIASFFMHTLCKFPAAFQIWLHAIFAWTCIVKLKLFGWKRVASPEIPSLSTIMAANIAKTRKMREGPSVNPSPRCFACISAWDSPCCPWYLLPEPLVFEFSWAWVPANSCFGIRIWWIRLYLHRGYPWVRIATFLVWPTARVWPQGVM